MVETVAFGETDVPLRARTGEFAGAVVLMVSVPIIAPPTGTHVGANVTATLQEYPGCSAPTQLFVWENWLAFRPPIVTLVIVIAAVPLFVTVTVWAVLIVPTS